MSNFLFTIRNDLIFVYFFIYTFYVYRRGREIYSTFSTGSWNWVISHKWLWLLGWLAGDKEEGERTTAVRSMYRYLLKVFKFAASAPTKRKFRRFMKSFLISPTLLYFYKNQQFLWMVTGGVYHEPHRIIVDLRVYNGTNSHFIIPRNYLSLFPMHKAK